MTRDDTIAALLHDLAEAAPGQIAEAALALLDKLADFSDDEECLRFFRVICPAVLAGIEIQRARGRSYRRLRAIIAKASKALAQQARA